MQEQYKSVGACASPLPPRHCPEGRVCPPLLHPPPAPHRCSEQEQYKSVGSEVRESTLKAMQSQMTLFRTKLEEFALRWVEGGGHWGDL